MKHLLAIKAQGLLKLLVTKRGGEYYLKPTTKKKKNVELM